MEQVEVWRGRHGDPVPLFGPLPGVRLDDTLAYEFELSTRFAPWPGRTLLERVFVHIAAAVSRPRWQPPRWSSPRWPMARRARRRMTYRCPWLA